MGRSLEFRFYGSGVDADCSFVRAYTTTAGVWSRLLGKRQALNFKYLKSSSAEW